MAPGLSPALCSSLMPFRFCHVVMDLKTFCPLQIPGSECGGGKCSKSIPVSLSIMELEAL